MRTSEFREFDYKRNPRDANAGPRSIVVSSLMVRIFTTMTIFPTVFSYLNQITHMQIDFLIFKDAKKLRS